MKENKQKQHSLDINLKNEFVSSIRLGSLNKGGQGERIYSPYGTSITLSAYGGGVGSKTGLYLINGRIRRLSRENVQIYLDFPGLSIFTKTKINLINNLEILWL